MSSIAVIQFPGSNTERETLMACRRVGLKPVEFLWNESTEKLLLGGFLMRIVPGQVSLPRWIPS